MDRKIVALAMVLSALIVAGCSRPQIRTDIYPTKAKDQYTRIKRIAIFPFENYTDNKDADKAVESLLVPAIREEVVFDEIEDTRFTRDVMKKLKITSTDILDREVVKKLADEMNVQAVLGGKVVGWGKKGDKGVPPQVTMDMVMIEPGTGAALWLGNVTVRGSLTWDEVFGWGSGYLEVDVARSAVGKLATNLARDVRQEREKERKGRIAEARESLSKEEARLKELQAQTGKTQAEIDKAKAEAQKIRDDASKEAETTKSDLELQKAAVEAEKAKADKSQQAVEQEKLKVEMERKKIDEDLRKVEEERKKLEEERRKAEEAKKGAEAIKEEPVKEAPAPPAEAPAPAPPAEAPAPAPPAEAPAPAPPAEAPAPAPPAEAPAPPAEAPAPPAQ